MREYRCGKIVGDKYGAQWTIEAFAKQNVRYEQSKRDRSAVYMDLLPLVTSGRARVIDDPKLISEGAALERRTFSTGRERIDPGPSHDDHINSAALAMTLADSKKQPIRFSPAALARLHTQKINRYGSSHTVDPGAVDLYGMMNPLDLG
jgi:hypothetical protein